MPFREGVASVRLRDIGPGMSFPSLQTGNQIGNLIRVMNACECGNAFTAVQNADDHVLLGEPVRTRLR